MIALESAPLTAEDSVIWRRVGWRWPFRRNCFLESTVDQDRRDAKLMLLCLESRQTCDRHGMLHCHIAYDGLFVPGFDDPERGLFQQGLALLIPKLPQRYRV